MRTFHRLSALACLFVCLFVSITLSAPVRASVPASGERARVVPVQTACVAGDVPKQSLPYEKIAQDFAKGHGLDATQPESIGYEDALAKAFVQLKLGAFDVRFPRASLEKHSEDLRDSARALIVAQEKWLDWLAPAGGDQKSLRDDLKILANWVKGWKVQSLVRAKDQTEPDMARLLNAPDPIAQASQRLYDALGRGAALGPVREQASPVRLVIAPTRKDFAEFIYFVGWIVPDNRGLFWLDNVPDWTQCYVGSDQVIALEYAAANRKSEDYTLGTPMDEVLEQQVVQLAMNSLFGMLYGEKLPGPFIGGLSMNLVIDAYGAVRTRIDGDTRSKVTAKREVFVAGGASEGGFLGKNSAETKWRENGGKDHFLVALRNAQEEGAKLCKDSKTKHACFSIRSDSEVEKWAAVAPFLGEASASAKAPPKEFAGDFAEFYRAYKSAFMFWLQTKAMPSEKAARERFAVLLKKLADPNLTGDFEEVFKEVYEGAPLSSPEVDKESLEGRFLNWLSRQK
jgi:hypothetical protein